jgi:hypothetical protein
MTTENVQDPQGATTQQGACCKARVQFELVDISQTFYLSSRRNARHYHRTFDAKSQRGRVTNASYYTPSGVRDVWIDPKTMVIIYCR